MSTGIAFPGDGFEHLRRQAEQMQRAADAVRPLAERLTRDQERWLTLMDPVTEQMIQEQERWTTLARPLTERLATHHRAIEHTINPEWFARLQEATRGPALLAERLNQAARPWERQFEDLARAGEALSELTRRMTEATRLSEFGLAEVADQLRTAELARDAFTQRLRELEAAETVEEREDLVGGVLSALIAWVRALPASAISRLAVRNVLHLLLAVLPYLLWAADRYADAQRDERTEAHRLLEEEWQENVARQLAELNQAVDSLYARSAHRVLYQATRALPLRAAPHKEARRVATVRECAIVEEAERKGGWLHVLYLDLESGDAQEGWIYHRSLRVLVLPEDSTDSCAETPIDQR